ncbi:MAG: signal transduction histidine kinase, partial [Bradymonadia bacterium]
GNSKLETFALAELLERAAQDARELRADIEVRANLDPMELYANEDLVRRAVGNLLSNAVRHCNSVVSLTITRSDDSIFIVVKDDGAGVPATARERIFEPFAQLDESRQRDAGGAGLGLAIVRRIAEAHGGSVRVGEAKAGGARFVLELPLRPV